MKNSLALAVAFLMIISFLCQPLSAAKERRGSTVEVTLVDGKEVTGELLAVKSDSLWIFDHDAGRGENLDLQHVIQVKVLKKARVLQGLAMGLGAGIVLSIMIPHDHEWDDLGIITHLYRPIVISCLGGIIGNQASIPKRFSLTGASPLVRQSKLERLGRYAREQCVGKPAGLQ